MIDSIQGVWYHGWWRDVMPRDRATCGHHLVSITPRDRATGGQNKRTSNTPRDRATAGCDFSIPLYFHLPRTRIESLARIGAFTTAATAAVWCRRLPVVGGVTLGIATGLAITIVEGGARVMVGWWHG